MNSDSLSLMASSAGGLARLQEKPPEELEAKGRDKQTVKSLWINLNSHLVSGAISSMKKKIISPSPHTYTYMVGGQVESRLWIRRFNSYLNPIQYLFSISAQPLLPEKRLNSSFLASASALEDQKLLIWMLFDRQVMQVSAPLWRWKINYTE